MIFHRQIKEKFKKALEQFPVCLITGPRQAGKSTFLQHEFSQYTYVTLDDPLHRQLANEDPELFLSQYKAPVIIDEIQNAGNLLPYIKMKVDRDRREMGQFILTGSQTFQVMEGISESLAGRVAIFHLYPFSWSEIEQIESRKKSSLNDSTCFNQILLGFYPEFLVQPNLNLNLWHGSYITTYIERDIRKIRAITDLSRFQTFLGLLATRAGKLLNLSEIAKECSISQPTARDWVSILESTYIITLLHPYYKNITKRLVKSPKLYFIDTGLLCYLLGIDTQERLIRSPDRGSIFENMVVVETIKRQSFFDAHSKCFFYRMLAGTEVDLICEHHNKLLAYEIKMSKTLSKDMVKPLTNFKNDFPESQTSLLSLHEENVQLTKEVLAVHWSQVLT